MRKKRYLTVAYIFFGIVIALACIAWLVANEHNRKVKQNIDSFQRKLSSGLVFEYNDVSFDLLRFESVIYDVSMFNRANPAQRISAKSVRIKSLDSESTLPRFLSGSVHALNYNPGEDLGFKCPEGENWPRDAFFDVSGNYRVDLKEKKFTLDGLEIAVLNHKTMEKTLGTVKIQMDLSNIPINNEEIKSFILTGGSVGLDYLSVQYEDRGFADKFLEFVRLQEGVTEDQLFESIASGIDTTTGARREYFLVLNNFLKSPHGRKLSITCKPDNGVLLKQFMSKSNIFDALEAVNGQMEVTK